MHIQKLADDDFGINGRRLEFLVSAQLLYGGSTEAAIAAFAYEAQAGNPALPDARRALDTLFAEKNAAGPIKAAHIVWGAVQPGESADTHLSRLQLREDMAFAAAALLRSL
jgi:hypothetical protein